MESYAGPACADAAAAMAAAAAMDAAAAGGGAPAFLRGALPAIGRFHGISTEGLPADQRANLARAGMPLAAAGTLRWGGDLLPGDGWKPVGAALAVPPAGVWAGADGVALKPLRGWLRERAGMRPKLAPGVRLWWCDGGIVVLSLRDLQLGGFVIGPRPGARAAIALPPFGWQVVPL